MELLGDSRLELRMHVLSADEDEADDRALFVSRASSSSASSMEAACSIGDDGLVGHEIGLL